MQGKKMVSLFIPLMALGLVLTSFVSCQMDEISCSEAIPNLAPCLPYFIGFFQAQPSAGCCGGFNIVVQKADTTQNRRDLCDCFKKASIQFNVNGDKAKKLPQLCNINLSFALDPQIDCNT
jgi:hypothetical protein